ncbi:barstar family protein [Amycolatopsis sp. DSM 110486]|uniref:barstar family protein n=1 Tax=Amycolatopsis sp. DSM 110486 TaxID=2865832 RepID=UPI001C69D597|nr:barstar family protein [Amycolatopsis sp. DSM 110486]QYN18871.1 barstar family protein [Amycolatopsis sp. DSM 110486]
MAIDKISPLYRLVDEGDEKLLAVAEEVEGFFVSPDKHHGEVAFLNVRVSAHAPKRTDDAILYIINSRQETIGEYFIGRVVFGSGEVNYWSGNKSRFEFRFFGNRCEVPGTGEIWRRWASGVPVRKGEWLDLSLDQQESWLHVVQNSWFTTGHRAGRYGDDDIVHLDGAQISTKTGFYCALGEAVNGPGGYFGSNLDALVDCIRSSPAHKSLIGIRWDDFAASREALGIEFIDAVMGVMHEFGVEVTCL